MALHFVVLFFPKITLIELNMGERLLRDILNAHDAVSEAIFSKHLRLYIFLLERSLSGCLCLFLSI